MILQRLYEYATRMPDIAPYAHRPAFVTKIIRLRPDGSLHCVVPAGDIKRGSRVGAEFVIGLQSRSGNIDARCIADNPNYVLGRPRHDDDPAKVARRHKAYCDLVDECAQATGEPSVRAISKWLSSGGAALLANDPSIKDDDEFIFEVGATRPTDLKSVQDFWVSRVSAGYERKGVCLVTGQYGPIVQRVPGSVSGIPNGLSTGSKLICVDKESGESYGLGNAYNSPISPSAADMVTKALQRLLSSRDHSVRLGNVVYVFWALRGDSRNLDLVELLTSPDSLRVAAFLKASAQGRQVATDDEVCAKDYCVLVMSANASRIVVREYHELTVDTLQANLSRWFRRLSLVTINGGQPEKLPGIYAMASSLVRDAKKDLPSHIPVALMASAMSGSPIPMSLLALAIKRNNVMRGPYVQINGKRRWAYARLALIKAIIAKEAISLDALNQQHPSPAYHCGRLLCVLERLQRYAIGKVSRTVADAYFPSASTRPKYIFGILLMNAKAHLAKLGKTKYGNSYMNRDIEEITGLIGGSFPATLDLEGQGLFALGYYHQQAHDYAKAKEAKEARAALEANGKAAKTSK